MTESLHNNGVFVDKWCCDGDTGFNELKNISFFELRKAWKLCKNEIWLLFKNKFEFRINSDLMHLLRNSKNRFEAFPLCTNWFYEVDFISLEDLYKKGCLPDIDPGCLMSGSNFKLRDDLAHKLFSKEYINNLFVSGEGASAVYFMLHYPLTLTFVKMNEYRCRRLIIICLITMLELHDRHYKRKGQFCDRVITPKGLRTIFQL